MFFGIIAGLLSACLMSGSFILSRAFIRKYGDPVRLAVFSQIAMGIGGAVMLIPGILCIGYPASGRFYLYLAGEILFFLIGQTSFFMMIKKVEASRAASLLGTKILSLALLATLLGDPVMPMQWAAVLLCAVAAVGMNLSGIRISAGSFFWLLAAVTFYALCDICITGMMLLMPGGSMIVNALGVTAICFTSLGIAVLPALWKYPMRGRELLDAVPYGLFYYLSLIFLMASFAALGVVFGGIIQAGRGIISVVLGFLLLRMGIDKSEPPASRRMWIRRLCMAVLMLAAMVMYTLSGR